jgi:hypothetical protein
MRRALPPGAAPGMVPGMPIPGQDDNQNRSGPYL